MSNTRKKKVDTFSYTLPPSVNKRWEKFAEGLGLNRSQAFTILIPAILDAFEESEAVFSPQDLREIAISNKTRHYPSESSILFAMCVNVGFPITE